MLSAPSTVATPNGPFPPSLQQAIRDRFWHVEADPFTGQRVYFENAGGSLTLRTVMEADLRIGALPDNAGRANPASENGRIIQDGRNDVAAFLNARDGSILCEQSTTACVFRILDAAALGIRGTNMECSALDHASTYDATQILAQRHQLEHRIAPLNRTTGALDADALAARARVDERTVAVSVIHASNITGGRCDLASIVARIRERAPQAIILADGAQHAQHGVVDVSASGVDAYVFSAYKIFSKPGAAFTYLSPRLVALPHAQLLGKPASDWALGTRDPGGFAAFSCVIDYLCWLGAQTGGSNAGQAPQRRALIAQAMHAIERHEAVLSKRLLHGSNAKPGLLSHPRVTLHGNPHPHEGREAVFAFSVEGMATPWLIGEFARRGVIVHDRVSDAYSRHTLAAFGVREVVRVSLAHYNTPAEVDIFLGALREILRTNSP